MNAIIIAGFLLLAAVSFQACSSDPAQPDNTSDTLQDNTDTTDTGGKDTTNVIVEEVDSTLIPADLDFEGKDYDKVKGGLQIWRIYFNQGQNEYLTGLEDEWIIFRADGDMATGGYTWDAGDQGQNYALPDSIHSYLVVFTRKDTVGRHIRSLGLNKWIWNNSDPDTASLYDAQGNLIDTHTY